MRSHRVLEVRGIGDIEKSSRASIAQDPLQRKKLYAEFPLSLLPEKPSQSPPVDSESG